ncbi:unnamed protein product [Didymodactylos carnosus]|uniref:Amidohydrolase 3 domain-containing protein n=1 Tax=Didymodactylos carnosus TaxID=1234261 RepID=A0A8S2EDP9_9BILA|nr:unnamed protein product [Didymodactylos carnosus]CAF3892297.1 unnamed protein product [Didymodactylos carnosus]
MAVGSNDDVLIFNDVSKTKILDLNGKTTVPGFIDSHSHIGDYTQLWGLPNLALPPVGTNSYYGYDDSMLDERQHPQRTDLDYITNDHPFCLLHISQHLAVCNSLALLKVNITRNNIPVIPGGVIILDNNGEPIGRLEEQAVSFVIYKLMKPKSFEQAIKDFKDIQNYYASFGITTVQDGYTSKQFTIELLLKSDLILDIVSYLAWMNADEYIDQYKININGSPQGKTVYLTQPYLNPPIGQLNIYRGYPVMNQNQLDYFYDKFYSRKWQIQTHRNAHTFYWGDWHRTETLGEQRAKFISPLHYVYDKQMRFSIHSDAPIIPPDRIFLIWTAVNRQTRSGIILGEDQCITAFEALKACTINAAYQYFEENIKGSITLNKYADLTILSENSIKVDSNKIKDIVVLQTIKEEKNDVKEMLLEKIGSLLKLKYLLSASKGNASDVF